MKAVFALVLVALFAVVASSPVEESDFALLPIVASWALKKYAKKDAVESDKIDWSRFKKYLTPENLQKAVDIWKILKQKDATESDAEFLSKLKKWWDTKGKGMFEKGKNLFNKGKEIYAILKNKSESDKIDWSRVKKYLTPENLQKAVDIWKILKQKDSTESDAEFLSKLKKWWDTKGKGMFEKGKNLFNKGKEIYAILKNKSESDKINWSGIKKYLTPENLQKAVDIWKILKNKDAIESDAEFGKLFKKIGGVVKKGVDIYKKVKSVGILEDEEADQQFSAALISKLKDRLKEKLQKQLKEDSVSKRLCVLTKLRAKPFCASRAKVESDKINFKNLFSQKNIQKAIGIYKAIKGEASESDSEFLSKLKKFWDTKGKNWFNKGKEIYAILKNKGEDHTEADAEFFGKIKQWWDNKGKNLFNKGKEYFNKGKEIYAILKNKSE